MFLGHTSERTIRPMIAAKHSSDITVPKLPASVSTGAAKLPVLNLPQVLNKYHETAAAADTKTSLQVPWSSALCLNGSEKLLAGGMVPTDALNIQPAMTPQHQHNLLPAPIVSFAPRNNVTQSSPAVSQIQLAVGAQNMMTSPLHMASPILLPSSASALNAHVLNAAQKQLTAQLALASSPTVAPSPVTSPLLSRSNSAQQVFASSLTSQLATLTSQYFSYSLAAASGAGGLANNVIPVGVMSATREPTDEAVQVSMLLLCPGLKSTQYTVGHAASFAISIMYALLTCITALLSFDEINLFCHS